MFIKLTAKEVRQHFPEAWAKLEDEFYGSEGSPNSFRFIITIPNCRLEAHDLYPDPMIWNGKEWLQ